MPQRWFNLHIYKAHGKYAIAAIPNLQRSVDRFYLRMGLEREPDDKITILFKPLGFGAAVSESFRKLVTNKVKYAYLSLLDAADFPRGSALADLNQDKIGIVGKFKLHRDSFDGYLDQYIDDLTPPTVNKW